MLKYKIQKYLSTNKTITFIIYIIIFIISNSLLFYHFEKENNEKINQITDSIWWLIVTLTTVGYGDIYPETLEGRIISVISMLLGISFLGTLMAKITSSLIEIRKKEMLGIKSIKFKNHLIICGYPQQRLPLLIERFRWDKKFISLPIVLISNTISRNPLPEEYKFYFIQGNPHDENVLIKAGIKKASWLIVLSESEKQNSDEHTILAVMLAEQLNPNIYSIAELISPLKKKLLSKTNCNKIITASDVSMNLMVQSIQDPSTTKIMEEFLNQSKGTKIYKSNVAKNKKINFFKDLVVNCLKENQIAIGIERNNKYILNPKASMKLEKDDFYFYIA